MSATLSPRAMAAVLAVTLAAPIFALIVVVAGS